MKAKAFALGAAVALAGLTASAQSARIARPAAADAADPKTVLFRAADALGMLRGLQQEDSITTFEFWATGTMNDAGQPLKLTNYRGSVRFRAVPGMRVDFTGAAPGRAPARQIRVVAGKFAWNEIEPGLNASPAMASANERLLQLWALPQGVVKGAAAAGDRTTVKSEGGATILSFPVPDMDGATLTATLNAKNLVERVVTRLGEASTETTYADYGDLNERDYKADVLFPRRITQKRGTITVLDLTIMKTNTYNPYVIMPVPDNVGKLAGGSP